MGGDARDAMLVILSCISIALFGITLAMHDTPHVHPIVPAVSQCGDIVEGVR